MAQHKSTEGLRSTLKEAPLPPPYKKIDPELVTYFFLVFSRFEYALKRVGFVWKNNKGHVQSDWKKFARSIESDYEPHATQELSETVAYLCSWPPQRQIVKEDGSLGWEAFRRKKNQTEVSWLLDTVKMVRNNLFHGVKHMEEPARNNKLLESSLIVLGACLRWSPEVEEVYETYGR